MTCSAPVQAETFDYKMPPFPRLLGLVLKEHTAERVVAEVRVTQDHANLTGAMHGGAMMALADQCGGMATGANLRPGQGTVTIESKTSFFAAIPVGDLVRLECTPLHRGRSTMVWQTKISRGDGKLAAIVSQTQMVLTIGSQSGSV